ncbi:MAG: cell division protein SepF [Ruminococcaceae bacterium]|nr:cell division protein SepF [Oscillospiraceae bacterium]
MGLFNFNKIKDMVYIDENDPYKYGKEEKVEEMKQEETLAPANTTAQKPALGISGQEDSVVELKVVRPESFSNVTEIADYLLNHCTVVLNLEATNREVAKRLIDFLAGVAYSIDGQLKNVANNTYIITPCNVDVADTQVRAAEAQQNFANQTANTNSGLTSDSLF